MADKRQFSEACERNKQAIYEKIRPFMLKQETLLEVASGTGQHAVFMAALFPDLKWQPSNLDRRQVESVEEWMKASPSPNILPPVQLDACQNCWPVEQDDYAGGEITAIFNANMIHISPWEVCLGLMAGAGRILPPKGQLILYGPYKVNGRHTASSNQKFENWLKSKNPDFGVRDIGEVVVVAEQNGLDHRESYEMPANNFLQLFEKR